MITKTQIVSSILSKRLHPVYTESCFFAHSNIALIKYWGKRDKELNLPLNSSISISLRNKGVCAQMHAASCAHHITVQNESVPLDLAHIQHIAHYLDLFTTHTQTFYTLSLEANIPYAAGLASSACVFAAIIQALNALHQWKLSDQELSILARLGSGSAARSILPGFVLWNMGQNADGMDSFATSIPTLWPDLCIGLCWIDPGIKKISSRFGMQHTQNTSPLFKLWPSVSEHAIPQMLESITQTDFVRFGTLSEHNALTMHATAASAWPPLIYDTPETLEYKKKIWWLRQQGIAIYFTQDAGPNLKLLCLKENLNTVECALEKPIEWIYPFDPIST